MKARDASASSAQPWIADGRCSPEYEDLLIGNRPGLERLKESIETALARGESTIEGAEMEFAGVRVVDADPRGSGNEPEKTTPKQRATTFGCLLLAFLLVFVLIAGLIQIVSWFR